MRRLLQALLLLVGVLLIYLNYQLYYRPQFSLVAGQQVNQDVVAQLRFLRVPLHHHAAEQMQQIYPEGFVYLNALYSLSWTELASHLPPEAPLYQEALAESAWAIHQIQSPTGQQTFDPNLPLPFGAFYQGWLTYSQGRFLAAQQPAHRNSVMVAQFEQQCAQIAQVLQVSDNPYPESYTGSAWPADVVMCVAALAWHDKINPPQYHALIRRWLRAVDTRLDSLDMIPHRTKAGTGQVAEAARGSSQSQLLNFLVEIDSVYAHKHFLRYRRYFLTTRLGLPGVREYVRGAVPLEDIDTGPVIWQVGGAASLVGRRTMQRYADTAVAIGLRNSMEAYGLPTQGRYDKRYLFGQLPIADAFIAWSNSVEATHEIRTTEHWRIRFQLLSVAILILLIALFLWLQRAAKGA